MLVRQQQEQSSPASQQHQHDNGDDDAVCDGVGGNVWSWNPSPLLLERCSRKGSIEVSASHEDFPAVLADLLDGILAAGFVPAKVAKRIPNERVGTNSVVRFLYKHASAIHWVNRERATLGMRPLKAP
jgi:hypothetical protein